MFFEKPFKFTALFYNLIFSIFTLVVPLTTNAADADALIDVVKEVEQRLNARLGLAVHDMETTRRWEYQSNERFPLTSTFKTLACATLLDKVDSEEEKLGRVVTFDETDLVAYSPVTEKYAGTEGMSLAELCSATLSTSDNSAANFILSAIGGPEAVTSFLRSIGDKVTRLDRWEPALNEAAPKDERDTTTANAMIMTLEKLVIGETLSTAARQQLQFWLENNQVGGALFRAGVPNDWVIADRTGAGGHGSRSITAVMWPPGRKAVVAALYITETDASFDDRNAAIAKIGAAIAQAVLKK